MVGSDLANPDPSLSMDGSHGARRAILLNVLAAAPLAMMAIFTPDLVVAIAKLDPLVVFRLVMLLWVLSHIWLNIEHLVEDIINVREYLCDLEKADPRMKGLAGTGKRAFLWALARVIQIAVRVGWPTFVLAGVAIAINLGTWLVMAGWRPEFLRGIVWS